MESVKYDFLFSVVIPIYNTERYLSEAIESVLQQTIGFENNIQLILVNNATTDNSGTICEYYQSLYPNNIKYLVLEKNQGPSGARNEGKKFAIGKYINFMDSDDKWGLDAFEKVWNLFLTCDERVNCVACRINIFGKYNGWHAMDHKFKQTRIADVYDEYDVLQLHTNSVFISAKAIKDHWFDITMKHAEDTKFVNLLILKTGCYALMREAVYYYRKRDSGDSLLTEVQKEAKYYTSDLEKSIGFFVQYSIEQYGSVIPYIQYMIAYSLKWRSMEYPKGMPQELGKRYFDLIDQYLGYVENYIILEQKNLSPEQKNALIQRKRGENVYLSASLRKGRLFYENMMIYSLTDKKRLHVEIIEVEAQNLIIKGLTNIALPEGTYSISLSDTEKEFPVNLFDVDESNTIYSFGSLVFSKKMFTVSIPLIKDYNIQFILHYKNYNIKMNFSLGRYSKISTQLSNAYYSKNGWMLRILSDNIISVVATNEEQLNHQERLLIKEFIQQKNWKALFCRVSCQIVKFLNSGKQIWLITDRILTADDSGEYFFRFLSTVKNKNIKPYFVISKESLDYTRLKKYGKVVNYRSFQHRVLFLSASKIISSLANDWVLNAIPYSLPLLRDMLDYKFIHLQHGVIKDDISASLNCLKKNMKLFVTSGKREQQSIIDLPYGYNESIVKVVGLPRFDCINEIQNQIKGNVLLIAPTWREYLVGLRDANRDTYLYNDNFKSSVFFTFYNALINDSRILRALSKHKMRGAFRLHPMLQAQNCDFVANELISVQEGRESYCEDINQTAMIVTDYSSAAFDYAYFNRPIIYTQFDREEFYQRHTYKQGYFDYERDGFGSIHYDYESSVQAIIDVIENGCVMEEKYRKRVDGFFAYHDGKNCERIYQEILNMDKESGE